MPKKKQPPKPYYPLRHEFFDSLTAYEQAAGMLYNSVTTILSIAKETKITDPVTLKMFQRLQEAADGYEFATHRHES